MTIDWNAFTPWPSLLGGMMIGLAAAMLILINGRIAGISGIIGGLFRPLKGDIGWRLAFLIGLASAPLVLAALRPMPALRIDAGWPLLMAAGMLVGLGTRYGAGCTSGHGVCGLSRLSPRSFVATLAFMASGFITVYGLRHILAHP